MKLRGSDQRIHPETLRGEQYRHGYRAGVIADLVILGLLLIFNKEYADIRLIVSDIYLAITFVLVIVLGV